jgi:hypothetical protein
MLCTQSNTCAFLYVHTLLPVSASSGIHVTNLLMLICMPWNEERLQIRIVCWSQVDPKIIEKRELVANSHTSTFALLLWRCPTKCHCISAGSCQIFPHSHPSFLEHKFLILHQYGRHTHTHTHTHRAWRFCILGSSGSNTHTRLKVLHSRKLW